MDCSLVDRQTSVNCLDESIKNLTETNSIGSNNSSSSNSNSNSSPLKSENPAVKLRKFSERCLTTPDAKTSTYRISMANLEETQESELDVILGELSLLEAQINSGDLLLSAGVGAAGAGGVGGGVGHVGGIPTSGVAGHLLHNNTPHSGASTRTHSRTNSTISGATLSISGSSESGSGSGSHSDNGMTSSREPRTESPDNDSAFSDTVSLLSSESSASSSVSSANHHKQLPQQQQHQHHHHQHQHQHQQQQQQHHSHDHHHHHHHHQQQQQQQIYLHQINNGVGQQLLLDHNSKAAKIQLALHKLEHASIRRLFVKAFTADGASKSLLVDERMSCGHVTRLLADKNHVQMQTNWALVENLGDLQMERLFEDHELLVDNLMTWNSDAGNRVLFLQRSDKISLFVKPEVFLPGPQMAPGSLHDEHTRAMLLEEFFETNSQLQVDGPLYMKADSKKGWKRYHFVLRSSGLYYFPKEKTKNTRDLACLTLFNGYNLYRGLNWKKKWKAPTDYTFGFKSAVDSSLGKTCRTLRMLCAEDLETMEKWITAIRISKYGKQLWDNHKALLEDLQRSNSDGLSISDGMSNSSFASSMRSESISSISSAVPSQCGSVSSAISTMSSSSSGRISRASSSSSSGCLSDDNNAFDSEFTTGTIKRKPSMKPNLPLTTMTRQLKEVGEITICEADSVGGGGGQDSTSSPERSGTLTRRHSRRKSQESNGSGTLKKRQQLNTTTTVTKRGSVESMNTNSSSSNSTPTPTPSICSKPLAPSSAMVDYNGTNSLPVASTNVMTSSTLSLDSLPPPPPPPPIGDEHELYGSQLSLVSLPPPPPPEEVLVVAPPSVSQATINSKHYPTSSSAASSSSSSTINPTYPPALPATTTTAAHATAPPAVPAKPIKPAVKAAPPYKAPPEYVGSANNNSFHTNSTHATNSSSTGTGTGTGTQKKVSFADSPVLLRRKMCSPEPRSPPTSMQQQQPSSSHPYSVSSAMRSSAAVNNSMIGGPLPPPRADATRLSAGSSQDFGSPKRLQESTSNPPRDFLKDLQRVMRKKWQVAQKCKLEPATTPHEVLGFRDFNDELLAHNLNSSMASSHYYRETANVSNWVQEHYGAGAPPALAGEYALYENLNNSDSMMVEPQFPIGIAAAPTPGAAPPPGGGLISSAQRKKRPPPPPPKRSDSTHLTHRV